MWLPSNYKPRASKSNHCKTVSSYYEALDLRTTGIWAGFFMEAAAVLHTISTGLYDPYRYGIIRVRPVRRVSFRSGKCHVVGGASLQALQRFEELVERVMEGSLHACSGAPSSLRRLPSVLSARWKRTHISVAAPMCPTTTRSRSTPKTTPSLSLSSTRSNTTWPSSSPTWRRNAATR